MYNLNINMATSAANAVNNLLSVENSCTTPRTPEILNSLIAMTNPMDSYNFGVDTSKKFQPNNLSSDSNSSSCSQESRTAPTNGLNSVQQTCSQLIKAGLKLSIEQKRKLQSDSEDLLDLDKVKRIKRNESESEEDKCHNTHGFESDRPFSNISAIYADIRTKPNRTTSKKSRDKRKKKKWRNITLTPEDEERRRRRRERNKIAATKCRLKKRERTANLVSESEVLENQNVDLKGQLQELQAQKRHLVEILTIHRTSCQKVNSIRETPVFSRLPPVHSVIESNHSYDSRPPSVDNNNYRTQNLDNYNRPASTGNSVCYSRSMQYGNKNTTIIVESKYEDDYQTSLTNLDDPSETYSYNNQQCHNYPTSQQNYGNHGIDGCMA